MVHVSVLLLKGVAVVLLLIMAPLTCEGYTFYAVQGLVYCKKQCGETLHEASLIPGATVRLECKDIDHPQTHYATTDKNGHFFIHQLKNVARVEIDECQVFLVSPPKGLLCDKASDFRGGLSGAYLGHTNGFRPEGANFLVFTIGPFAFEPSSCTH